MEGGRLKGGRLTEVLLYWQVRTTREELMDLKTIPTAKSLLNRVQGDVRSRF